MATLTNPLDEWTDMKASLPKQRTPLLYFLGLVCMIFIGILIFVYVVTKQTNPVFLDEHGKPVSSQTQSTGH